MEVATLIFTIIGAIGGIGSFGCFILMMKDLKSAVRSLSNETLFGVEAEKRYKEISEQLKSAPHMGPFKWEGGKDFSYMLEIKTIIYDSNTMGVEWKNVKKSIRRVYTKNETMLVEIWGIM